MINIELLNSHIESKIDEVEHEFYRTPPSTFSYYREILFQLGRENDFVRFNMEPSEYEKVCIEKGKSLAEDEITQLFPDKIELDKTPLEAAKLIISIIKENHFNLTKEFLSKIDINNFCELDESELNESTRFLLQNLYKSINSNRSNIIQEHQDADVIMFIENIPKSWSFPIYEAKQPEIPHEIEVEIGSIIYNPISLRESKEGEDLKDPEYRNQVEEELRKEIDIDTNYNHQDIDSPSIDQQISSFPIDYRTLRKVNDWYVANVAKSDFYKKIGLTDVETKIYFKQDPFHIIFRTYNLSDESIEVYNKIRTIIPDFVSSQNYIELGMDEHVDKQNKNLTEVYAGPSLDNINIDALHPEIKSSIFEQCKYISKVAVAHYINQGHMHLGNFSVRFLLKSNEKGKDSKYLEMDYNKAIKAAIHNGYTITPIVTLRDWDIATNGDMSHR